MVNTVQKLTDVSNVTLAFDDDKRRRSQSCYKGEGMELVNTVQQLTVLIILMLLLHAMTTNGDAHEVVIKVEAWSW